MSKISGFTLLEVLIAATILTVGMTAIIWALSIGVSVRGTDIENANLALNIAQAKMEEIRNTPFSNLVSSAPTPDPDFPGFSVAVTAALGNDPMRVDVTVSRNATGGQTSLTLNTLRSNY